MNTTRTIEFKNKENLNLFGIVHVPPFDIKKKQAIIFLNAGIIGRVGPNRLYVNMARKYTELGYIVLRFDSSGLGDSEGIINERYVVNIFGSVQTGRFINDTKSAMDFIENEYGINQFILAGLCGGAITALLSGAVDKRVTGIFSLAIPVNLDKSNIDYGKYMTMSELQHQRDGLVRKIFKKESWLRLLTFKSDYRLILKSFITPIINQLKIKHSDSNKSSTPDNPLPNNFNQLFPKSLHHFASGRKIYLMFSDSDKYYWEFMEHYQQHYSKKFDELKKNIDLHIIKNSNHTLTFMEWQSEMLDLSGQWLNRNFS